MDRRQEIEKLAYELFQRNGCVPDRDLDHWLEAEQIICFKYAETPEKSVKPKMTSEADRTAKKKAEAKESKAYKKVSVKDGNRKAGTSRKEATL